MLKRVVISSLIFFSSLAAQAPGTYTGIWASGSSGSSGKLNLTFSDTGLTAGSFTIQGQEVKTKAVSSNANGNSMEFVFEYDIDGNLLRSRMQGTIDGKSIKGKYWSSPATGGASVDEGTWEVTQR